jgi:hypothetical protein
MLQIYPTKTLTLRVYDPAMCCSTGVCGPSVDTQLVQFASDLQWLEAQGVRVQRYTLSQQPDVFLQNKKVAGLLQAFDEKALPAILLNDDILTYGQYPSRDELANAVQGAKTHAQAKPQAPTNSCGPDCNC